MIINHYIRQYEHRKDKFRIIRIFYKNSGRNYILSMVIKISQWLKLSINDSYEPTNRMNEWMNELDEFKNVETQSMANEYKWLFLISFEEKCQKFFFCVDKWNEHGYLVEWHDHVCSLPCIPSMGQRKANDWLCLSVAKLSAPWKVPTSPSAAWGWWAKPPSRRARPPTTLMGSVCWLQLSGSSRWHLFHDIHWIFGQPRRPPSSRRCLNLLFFCVIIVEKLGSRMVVMVVRFSSRNTGFF